MPGISPDWHLLPPASPRPSSLGKHLVTPEVPLQTAGAALWALRPSEGGIGRQRCPRRLPCGLLLQVTHSRPSPPGALSPPQSEPLTVWSLGQVLALPGVNGRMVPDALSSPTSALRRVHPQLQSGGAGVHEGWGPQTQHSFSAHTAPQSCLLSWGLRGRTGAHVDWTGCPVQTGRTVRPTP